jgi:acylphosphatase
MLAVVTRHLRIIGRVQGVGYREAFCREADRLGLGGWVRNRGDGTVEALVRGEAGAVRAIIAWARRGPAAARVREVREEPAAFDLEAPEGRFERRPSA